MLKSSSAALSNIGTSSGKIFLNDEDVSFNSAGGESSTSSSSSSSSNEFDTPAAASSVIINQSHANSNSKYANEEDLNNDSVEYYNCNSNYYCKPSNVVGSDAFDSRFDMSTKYMNCDGGIGGSGPVGHKPNIPDSKSNSNGFSNNMKDFISETSQDFSLEKSSNDDLVTLNNLNELLVLDQLKKRYSKNQIYTYIGDILIAMNPLKPISIYGEKVSNYYKACENVRDKLPPHVYATAEQCFREMIRTQQSQCILISGESGSGKTETCKYLVQHLLNRTRPLEVFLNSKIQQVNTLLEAFGNAKTRINDNSSRFGKYLEIYFEQDGTVVGAKFKEYLLEKSRVVFQNEYETTFHIFYFLFAGLSAEEKLRFGLLMSPKKYRFMSNANVENCMSSENEEKFLFIKESLNTIGFSKDDVENMIKVLISILLIGEIQFVQKKGNNNDGVQVKNMEFIENVCELLEMEPSELSDALVSDVQVTRGEEIKRERVMVQACDVRDALAKALYGRLFSWIVNQINHHIQPAEGVLSSYSIGLLDIFGFENFERNSFEQMCINLANEQLHQLFTKYIFKLEIQECLDEQVELSNSDLITFQDNQIILDLFLEKRHGIFALLDEESRFPKATDQSLAIKLHQTLGTLYPEVYVQPKNVGTSFNIVHYAGQVLYNVEGFLEKNRDFLPNNLFYATRNSNNFLVQELFQCKLTRKGTIAPSDRQSKQRKSLNTFCEYDAASISTNKQLGINSNEATSSSSQLSTEGVTIVETLTSSASMSNKIKFTVTTAMPATASVVSNSTISSSSHSNNHNAELVSLVKNREDLRNSIHSHATTANQYASEKVLPLTVACHFKNSLHELIEKINKCKAYFIRCIKPSPNQENLFINEFVVKQLRYCSLMHVCKIRKCGFPYRIKFEEFLKWYRVIEICVLKKDEFNANANNPNNSDFDLQKCLKCMNYAKVTNFKVGKTKLFLRYWHIDIFNSIAKNLEKKVITSQKIVRGWLVRNRIKQSQKNQLETFLKQITVSSNNFVHKLYAQRNHPIQRNDLLTIEDDYLMLEKTTGLSTFQPVVTNHNKDPTVRFGNENSKKMINSNGNKNWPDLNEINHALEEFDSMLKEYENDDDQKENLVQNISSSSSYQNFQRFNKIQVTYQSGFQVNATKNINQQNLNKKSAHTGCVTQTQPVQISASSCTNPLHAHNNISNQSNKISPTSVYHLVNNNNNKNDNTLKKRNALVAFEFKTLLDKVSTNGAPASPKSQQNHHHHHPHHYHHHHYHHHTNQHQNSIENDHIEGDGSSPTELPSPPYLPSSHNENNNPHLFDQSTHNEDNTTNNNCNQLLSSSSSSTSSSDESMSPPASNSALNHPINKTITVRTISPSQLTGRADIKSVSSTRNMPVVELDENENVKVVGSGVKPGATIINHLVPSSKMACVAESGNEISSPKMHYTSDVHQNARITIWREEIIAKNNVQEKIKKQTELTQKLEDSKKSIPEWKRNLIKQKEMKKTSSHNQNQNHNLIRNNETPELMKHNIFLKKGLATQIK